jgi:Ca2+-binding RTX toxin-like protein
MHTALEFNGRSGLTIALISSIGITLATLACSSGSIDDGGTTTLSTFGSGTQSTSMTMTGEEMSTTGNETDDGDDPCAGVSPCQDATADIPITGGVGNSIVPDPTLDPVPWGMAGVGGPMVSGTESNDSLVGAELGDVIDGLGGNDGIDGFAGDDWLIGGNGNDSLDGAEGNDRLECGSGLDIGEGFGGLDLLYGGGGDDRLYGGGENDVLYGEAQVDELYGETGDDRLFGGDDGDTLDGDVGNDTLWGEAGDDTMLGRAGSDILIGGPGADMLEGGDDDDVYIWQLDDGDDIIDAEDLGNDVLWIGGYGPADLMPLRAGLDYVLVTPTGSIRVLNYYSGLNQIEAIQTELP